MAANLEGEMKQAAEKLDFEKAARLRNLLEDIKLTTKPAKRFWREFPTTVRPEEDLRDLQEALRLPAPPQRIECFDISNISTTHKVASMVSFRNGSPDKMHYRRYRIRTVEGQDDFASMAETVRRRYERVIAEHLPKPDLIIVDGGRGQLSAAHAELTALGLGHLRIIGLAKEREEIYRVDEKEPLALSLDRGAIKLLQRIRDEAHRFANGYHQILLKQRVKESALDECPGISERRKKILLTHFGSVEKLRRASAAEIGALPGIGKKLGETLVAFLQAQQNPRSPAPEATEE